MTSMIPTPFPSDPEAIRKELEFRDKQKASRQAEADFYAKRWRDRAAESGKAAVAFAQETLRTGQLLNGGGLLAIPAVVTLFGLDARIALEGLMSTGLAFGLGLLAAWSGHIAAFFALDARSAAEWCWADSEEAQVRHGHFRRTDDPWRSPEAEKADRQGRRNWRIFLGFKLLTILLALGAVSGFLAGANLGARTVLSTPPRAAGTAAIPVPSPAETPRSQAAPMAPPASESGQVASP